MRINYDDIIFGKEYYIIIGDDIEKITAYDITNNKIKFNALTRYSYNGKIILSNIIEYTAIIHLYKEDEVYIFTTKKEAVEYIKKRDRIIIDKYKSKIKTVKDLLELPFRALINDDDGYYINFNARDAYKERCYELLGIKISTDNLKELDDV